jgi:hypothetical protein
MANIVPTKKLAKCVGGGSKETSSMAPPSTMRSTPQKLKLAGRHLLSNSNDLVVPTEAIWLNQVDNK